jgi:hypothetical protein
MLPQAPWPYHPLDTEAAALPRCQGRHRASVPRRLESLVTSGPSRRGPLRHDGPGNRWGPRRPTEIGTGALDLPRERGTWRPWRRDASAPWDQGARRDRVADPPRSLRRPATWNQGAASTLHAGPTRYRRAITRAKGPRAHANQRPAAGQGGCAPIAVTGKNFIAPYLT